jgi:hypothetical protein
MDDAADIRSPGSHEVGDRSPTSALLPTILKSSWGNGPPELFRIMG